MEFLSSLRLGYADELSRLVGWFLWLADPSGYFMPKTFLFIIFIWYNFFAYSYLHIILFLYRWYLFIVFSLELSAEVSIWFFI